ncbi:MAG: carbohydrate-binding domain-containing protein, partial [Bacteroidales bacterium]|nr:carbohydrate-binding domain-containing protein [Bacteroidales bacterium]
GMHCNDGFWLRGGSLEIQSSGDGIDTDSVLVVSGGSLSVLIEGDGCKALKAEGTIDFSSGEVQLTTRGSALLESTGVSGRYEPSYCTAIKGNGSVSFTGATVYIQTSGKGGKGVSSGLDFVQKGGYLSVSTTGAGVSYTNAEGVLDAYQSTAITSDAGISLLDGTLIVSCSGSAAKGLNADGALIIGTKQTSPQIQIETSGSSIVLSTGSTFGGFRPGGGGETSVTAAEAKAIKCDGNVCIYNGVTLIYSADDGIKSQTSITMDGGSVSVLKSVEAFEAPVITVNGGTLSLLATDDCFNATYGNGGESNDGSILSFHGGLIQAGSTGGDAIDSNGSVVMSGGTVVAQGPASSPEVGIDVNGSFKVSGGILVASGPSTQNMEGTTTFQTSTQPVLICTGSLGTNVLHLTDANAVRLLSFMPVRAAASLTLSTPALSKGSSYKLYVGGSVEGSRLNGLYLDGDYDLGTLKKTLTINSSAQTVSF